MNWFDYLRDGILHITDFEGYDHMVYLIALVSIYDYREIKRVILLATAFTIGHSLTLILAGLDVIRPNSGLIEFLIPVSILLTGLSNLRYAKRHKTPVPYHGLRYLIAIAFGLIHGMGFSTYFRMIVDRGESIVQPLLFFNLGVEVGQLLIVIVFMLITFLFQGMFRIQQRDWILFFAGVTSGIAGMLCLDTWPW